MLLHRLALALLIRRRFGRAALLDLLLHLALLLTLRHDVKAIDHDLLPAHDNLEAVIRLEQPCVLLA